MAVHRNLHHRLLTAAPLMHRSLHPLPRPHPHIHRQLAPILVLHPQRLPGGHHRPPAPVPQRDPLVGLSGLHRPGPDDLLPGVRVLPRPRGNPDRSGGGVVGGVKDGGYKEIVQEEVLVPAGAGGGVLGPVQVTAGHVGLPGLGSFGTCSDKAGQQLIPGLQETPDGPLHLLGIGPGPVVIPVEPQDRAIHALGGPAQVVPSRSPVVPATIGVEEGFQIMDPSIHHSLHTGLKGNPVPSPPHGVPVLRGVLLHTHRLHPRNPVRQEGLGQGHGPPVELVPLLLPHLSVILVYIAVVHVGPPSTIGEAVPIGTRNLRCRAVLHWSRDREAPIMVKPPESKPLIHPLGQSLPAKLDLLRGRLQAPSAPPGHGVGMVIEIRPQPLRLEETEPVGVVGEQLAGRIVIEPVLMVCGIPPVHVQPPDIQGEAVGRPPLHLGLRVVLGVGVPPGEPGTIGVVRQQRNLPAQMKELFAAAPPLAGGAPQQEDVGVPVHIV
mmetsp:Transcript_17708/g.39012  ORF Transcript_17708/g.39012 Transcript_17708/m.39012 type:complete len:492 (-) Transcript_17708:767-2242(-)